VNRKITFIALNFVCCLLLAAVPAQAVAWFPFGPDGGDARSFAADPRNPAHIYMGTANGWVYESNDGGASWKRLARIDRRDDLVIDNIVVDNSDPGHLIAGAWALEVAHSDGGLYESNDGGHTWQSNPQMAGQSIRALDQSRSNPKILVVGALSGVWRSRDGGEHWHRISPEGSAEIHNIESVAIDPVDPEIIYAGTWHLPWKTTDGGAHWHNIKHGVIDDSDVFSIIIDPQQPKTVYISACSGIYKSEDAGEEFHKVQGIPSTARRTRVLQQDPEHRDVVFAGTTEGLFRTADAGKSWLHSTGDDVVINDVYVDTTHTDHVLLATDRGGVLLSNDGGFSFRESNRGFSARQISAWAADPHNPARVYAGVVNDKGEGGAFVSDDGGLSWTQREIGLEGRDVFSLAVAPDGTLLAGTNRGVLRWVNDGWTPVEMAAGKSAVQKPPTVTHSPKRATSTAAKPAQAPAGFSDSSVYALVTSGFTVYAATESGLLVSASSGESWKHLDGQGAWRFITAEGKKVLAADVKRMQISLDDGKSWQAVAQPAQLKQVSGIALDRAGELWVAGGEGVWFSEDNGAHWSKVPGLTLNDVNSIFYDQAADRMLLTGNSSTTYAWAVHTPDKKLEYWDTGWNLRLLRPVGDHLVAATLVDGVVVQPRWVVSPVQENK
jgi:photosystem II stability/assembly factor-like uncharacterized protein